MFSMCNESSKEILFQLKPKRLTLPVSTDLHFYIDPFSKLISKKLKSSCTDPTFGMVLATDELNQRVYIKSIAAKKSASKLFSRLWHVDGEHELVDVVVLYYYDVDDDSLVKETWSSWTTVQ